MASESRKFFKRVIYLKQTNFITGDLAAGGPNAALLTGAVEANDLAQGTLR